RVTRPRSPENERAVACGPARSVLGRSATRGASKIARERANGRSSAGELGLGQLQGLVLAAGVLPVLELDGAHLGEALAQPAVAGVEEPELLAVGDDLGEE